MTQDRQIKIAREIFAECIKTLETKGADYASDTDALANFKRNAERLGMSKYQVWLLYFTKHVDAIINSIKRNPNNPQVESEPIRSRVIDNINYLILFDCLMGENDQTSTTSYHPTGLTHLNYQ